MTPQMLSLPCHGTLALLKLQALQRMQGSSTCLTYVLGQFDRSNRVIRTGFKQLYSHVWTDNHSALLGFGDGFLRLFDIRMPHECVVWFQDQKVKESDRLPSIPSASSLSRLETPNSPCGGATLNETSPFGSMTQTRSRSCKQIWIPGTRMMAHF